MGQSINEAMTELHASILRLGEHNAFKKEIVQKFTAVENALNLAREDEQWLIEQQIEKDAI